MTTENTENLYYGFDRETHHSAERIIEQDIIQNASMFVEHKGFFNMFSYDPYEVINNLFNDSFEAKKEYVIYSVDEANQKEYLSRVGKETIEELTEEEIEELVEEECFESQPKDIFEWWQVSEWLYKKLDAIEEPVFEIQELGWYFWGRTCTGQAIILDGTIQKIVKGL